MRMQSKRTTEESTDRGVSPVIGVILMVAITVILAAVIAAFVLDIGPGDPDPSAGITVNDAGGGDVELTLNSLDDGTNGVAAVEEGNLDTDSPEADLRTTGDSETFSGDGNVIIAYSGDSPEDASNVAIIDNLDEYQND